MNGWVYKKGTVVQHWVVSNQRWLRDVDWTTVGEPSDSEDIKLPRVISDCRMPLPRSIPLIHVLSD